MSLAMERASDPKGQFLKQYQSIEYGPNVCSFHTKSHKMPEIQPNLSQESNWNETNGSFHVDSVRCNLRDISCVIPSTVAAQYRLSWEKLFSELQRGPQWLVMHPDISG